MSLEDRIIDLETKFAYQDHTIQELNEVIIRQQIQIGSLENQLQRIRNHLKEITPSEIEHSEDEAPPPHY
ncbi:MAG: SlyX family protein [Mariprofundaceae bacterium]